MVTLLKALIQRVCKASVSVDGEQVGAIDQGLLVLLGVERQDNENAVDKMVERLLAYRVFADSNGKMNLSLVDTQGQILIVSQFTLAADTNKGLRPSFSNAAEPVKAEKLYNCLVSGLKQRDIVVATGQFAAQMQVSLINDGPVTFLLEV